MGFIVRPKHKDKNSFYLIEEIWDPESSRTKQVTVKREAYQALGFRFDMSLDEARSRASQINKQSQLEAKKIVKAAKRVADDKAVKNAYLPAHLTSGFEAELNENYADNSERLNNLTKQWTIVKKMISELGVDTKNFYSERQKFFNYYRTKQWSPDYIKKLTRLTNLYGQFVSRKTNQYYQDVPKISSALKEKIVEARENVTGIKGAADPLTWLSLNNAKSSFVNESLLEHWNWLFIATWFGLRPKEVDSLVNAKTWRIETDPTHGVKVLHVYQSKLTGVAKDKRWKPIPIYFPEQEEAAKLIINGQFKRPLNKTLNRLLGDKIQTYSPRKGFTDLMLGKGFDLEDVSIFLGHADISMTWKHYKSKKTFKLPKTS